MPTFIRLYAKCVCSGKLCLRSANIIVNRAAAQLMQLAGQVDVDLEYGRKDAVYPNLPILSQCLCNKGIMSFELFVGPDMQSRLKTLRKEVVFQKHLERCRWMFLILSEEAML